MASKRHMRKKACGDKIPYTSQEAAEAKARDDCRIYHTRVRAYPCPFSGKKKHWHIGHQPARVRQAIAARRIGDRI